MATFIGSALVSSLYMANNLVEQAAILAFDGQCSGLTVRFLRAYIAV